MGRFPNIYTPQYSIYDVTLSAFKNKKLELFSVVAVIMNEIGCSLFLSTRGSVNLFIILNLWKAWMESSVAG